MNKKNIIIASIIALLLILGGVGYLISKSQQNKYVNFIDPKLTNEELITIEGKIKELESSVKTHEEILDKNNQDQKADLFKLEMVLAAEYRLRGRLLDARNITLKAQKLLPDNVSPWNELFVIDQARQDYDSAKTDIDKIIAINPANVQAWRWYFDLASHSLHFTPQQQDALYKEAIDKSSGNVDLITLYAQYLESNNDLVGAVAQLKKAIEKNPAGAAQYQAEIQRIQDKLK